KREKQSYSCSVIIPCYNEAENIQEAVERIPQIAEFTEIIVVDDGSIDGTAEIVTDLMVDHDNLRLISYSPNRGKGPAVKAGFDAASGDVLMILDADMTVPPEELQKFFTPISEGKADFVNGTRFISSMETQAMRRLNWYGNKVFAFLFSWLLGQKVTDTLCGTKSLLRSNYQNIEMNHCRWGDFDLLIGAAKLDLKIMEVPIVYRRRLAGESHMKPFKHGFLFFKTFLHGVKQVKLGRNQANGRRG
ncbi:glycosyltransferase family 2 protein, partial [candidate division KSB1 bacterium]|nr:glycosyltransferase family 2 protein [candidate division KSB1 bacterium]NIR72086.1 glycosyltransferase family 2 protein [candidate division KSB1 bacterium]NIS24350.1 glycosyltransferase family 2 protein [candidate division KSB1 bacterium]NIT71282.1 glycosyltransferase family 2 protein [candidate division KSB1 bacterium]NIU24983.1 glycosyltransferase family 2 protein [candidate division KSB1 bacterium]